MDIQTLPSFYLFKTAFVDDFIRSSICDKVRPDEVEKFAEEGVFTNIHDIHQVYEHVETYLPHAPLQ